jgi:hypothetical protein
MERLNFLLTLCTLIFGTLCVFDLAQHHGRVSLKLIRGNQDARALGSNYLWQRDDDDDYFGNANHTGYFSWNQNYRAQGNSSSLGGGSYVNGNTYSNNDDAIAGQDDDSNRGYNNQAAASNGGGVSGYANDSEMTEDSGLGWFSQMSPAQSAILGVVLGLLLLSILGCVIYGPMLYLVFTNWVFNRKASTAENYQLNEWA